MSELRILGVTQRARMRLQNAAARRGISFNEFLRRLLEQEAKEEAEIEAAEMARNRADRLTDQNPEDEAEEEPEIKITAADWQRLNEVFVDLSNPEVMDAAWR